HPNGPQKAAIGRPITLDLRRRLPGISNCPSHARLRRELRRGSSGLGLQSTTQPPWRPRPAYFSPSRPVAVRLGLIIGKMQVVSRPGTVLEACHSEGRCCSRSAPEAKRRGSGEESAFPWTSRFLAP